MGEPPPGYGGIGWSPGNHHDYDREYCVDLPAVAPCSWKYLFEISMPMLVTTLPMDPPLSCPERTPCALS